MSIEIASKSPSCELVILDSMAMDLFEAEGASICPEACDRTSEVVNSQALDQ